MLSDLQKYAIEKVRDDEVLIMSDLVLSDTILRMGKEGKTTDEILVWLWNNQNGDKYWLMPQAVNNFLTKKWLTAEMRKALRVVPILDRVDKGLMNHVDKWNAKVLMFMKEKLDKDFKQWAEGGVNIWKQITNITIQVVKDEQPELLEVIPEPYGCPS